MKQKIILVFDANVARFFMAKGLHISGLKAEYKSSDFNIARDREPRKGSLNQKGSLPGHYFDPHAEIKDQERNEFCCLILEKLTNLYHSKAFEELMIVADPKSLGALRQHLKEPLKSVVVSETSKDLTHLNEQELEHHLFS